MVEALTGEIRAGTDRGLVKRSLVKRRPRKATGPTRTWKTRITL